MKQEITKILFSFLILTGLFMSRDAKAVEINNPELKTAIEAFLKEGGDTGDGYQYNWERLGVPDPTVDEAGWWAAFCDHPNKYISKPSGSNVNLVIYTDQVSKEFILCCGELNLQNVSSLYMLSLHSNYLDKVTINGCSDLTNVDLNIHYSGEEPKANMDESIETIVNIENCPAIKFFYGYFPSVGSFTWTGTGAEDVNISLSAYNRINNSTVTGCGTVAFGVYAAEYTGDISVTDCSDFTRFSIMTENKNNNPVNIVFSNNSTANSYFDFASFYVPLTTLPELPSSIEMLEIECVGNNFSEPLDLSYLENLTTIVSRNCGFTVFPKLRESLTELNLNWVEDYFPGSVDLKNMANLKILRLYGFNQFPDLPASIQHIECNYYNHISGEIDLAGLSSLEILLCENNKITSIINIPSSLKDLYCSDNELTRITFNDVSSSVLTALHCFNNKITDFPAQLPISLEELNCENNEISGVLDLSGVTSLNSLNCKKNNLKEIKINDYTAQNGHLSVAGNRITVSKLRELARGFDKLFSGGDYYLPQQLTDEYVIDSGSILDMSGQLVDSRLSYTWFDITNDLEGLRYKQSTRVNNFSEYLTDNNKIADDTQLEEISHGNYLFKDGAKGKYLLGEVSETSEKDQYERYATYYCLVYVNNVVSNPEIVFEIKLNDKESVLPNNSETTIFLNSTVELMVKPPVIPEEITYDQWEITYFDSYSQENRTSGKIGKDDALPIELYFRVDMNITTISVVELKLYDNDVNVGTYSYAYAPYRQTFIRDNNPILWFEEKINEEEFVEIENNTTTTKDKGNQVFLRMGALVYETPHPTRSTPVSGHSSWEIEYTTSDGGTPVRSRRINIDEYYDFNEGNPHQDPGVYPYSVKRLFVYDSPAVDYNLRSSRGPFGSTMYDFTDNPYNHTIIIKGDGTEPEPEPEVGLQFAVSINDNTSFSDVPNLHTTTVAEENSVYLDIRTVTRNITFNSWKIEYTTPAGQNVSSGWLTAGAPHHFNSGMPHTIPGTYVYSVNQLQLQDEIQTYTYNYTGNPYRNTIVITEETDPEPPGPDPEPEFPPEVPEIPDPDPNPDAWIFIDPLAPLCYEEGQFLISVRRNTTDSLYYAICYPQTSLDAGFEKDSIFKVLPADGVVPVAVNTAIPKGFYYGYLVIWSKNKQETELYPFRIEVKDYVRITKQPEAVALRCEGDGFTLSVETEGEVLAYQWYRNREAIAGATTGSYEAVLSSETTGWYHVEIEGYCNTEISDSVNVGMSSLQVLMKWDDVMYVSNTDNRYVSFQWYKDGAPVSKYGTSVYYTDAQGLIGSYYVEATRADGTVDISCPITFDTLTRSTSVSVYPNPVAQNENLTVVLHAVPGKNESTQINILDMYGRLVYSKRTAEDTIQIPVNFPMGSYVIQVITAEGRVHTEIMLVK